MRRFVDERFVASGFVTTLCADADHRWVQDTIVRRHCTKCGLVESLDYIPRDSVLDFASAMEAVLLENDHKGGWINCDEPYLILRLAEEAKELNEALKSASGAERSLRVTKECVDVANFAMMIYDNVANGRGRRARPGLVEL